MAWDGPKWGREVLFPANPDLADILGDADFDFDFLDFFGSQISRFPGSRFPNFQKSGLGQAWAGLGPGLAGVGLGRAWALGRVGPSGGPGGPSALPHFIVWSRPRAANAVID